MLHCTEYTICARQISEIIAFLKVVGQTHTNEFETELICGVRIYPNSYNPNFYTSGFIAQPSLFR